MLIMTRNEYEEIRTWICRNARYLEITLCQYFFEGGSKEAVLSALAFYQNSDGGFGNTLEPDNWNPNSSPYTTLYAINALKSIDFSDLAHPIYAGIMRFLNSGDHYNENGWLFSIPSSDSFPHAPWWTFSEEANRYESIGVTAEISAFILRHADKNTVLYHKALSNARRILNLITEPGKRGDMGINGFCVLLETIRKTGLTAQLNADAVEDIVRNLVHDSITRDTEKWPSYCVRPSNYIKNPYSIYYDDNAEIVQAELDYLIYTRPSGNVWGIQWTWFENNDKYPKELAISTNWWWGIHGIEKMRFLKSFDRIDM